jgi:Icc-related predicted phosphoesterase
MKIQYCSDLHLEFYPNVKDRIEHLTELSYRNSDVIVVAGDFSVGNIKNDLKLLCDIFSDREVLYVTGNHEYYRSSKEVVDKTILDFQEANEYRNFHFLDKKVVEIDGVRFGGCTLWFPLSPENVSKGKSMMNDFAYIKNLEYWVNDEALNSMQFFKDNPVDVAITHHMPSFECVQPPYANSPSNIFYVNNILDSLEFKPKAWIHGHSHIKYTDRIQDVDFYSNPIGYPNENHDSWIIKSFEL